jgi:HAE1 family hydrophobic/amphiphilic exporter-1
MTHFRKSFLLALFAAVLAIASPVLAQTEQVALRSGASLATRSVEPETDKIDLKMPPSVALDLNRLGVQTAQPLPLSLRDAVIKALEANNTIEISRLDERFQATQVQAIKGFYDPTFQATPTFTRNQTTHDPATGSSVTRDFRVNSSVTGFIKPGGGDYSVFFNNLRTENAFAQAQSTSGAITTGTSALYSSASGFRYNQPLLRNFGIDNTRRNIRIAKKRLDQTDTDFRRQVSDTINQVERAYWDLVFALRDQQNRVANVNLARENLRQVEAKIQAGAAAPLERAEVATELANREADLILSTQTVSINENTLKQLVLRDPISAEWSQSYVPTEDPAVGNIPINLDAALKDAMDNRFELRRLKLEREINDVDIKYFKNQIKPQIDFNSTFSLQGLARSGSPQEVTTNLFTSQGDLLLFNAINQERAFLNTATLPPLVNPQFTFPASPGFLFGGFNQSLANMFRSDAPNFTIGVTISFPFFNRTAKANLAGARINEERINAQTRQEEQVVVVDVRNTAQAVESTRQRYLASRTARENAEIQLAGEQKLYESGKSTTFLLFQRENALANARNAEIRAQTDYQKAVADLQRATATSFRELNIDVQSPVTNPK